MRSRSERPRRKDNGTQVFLRNGEIRAGTYCRLRVKGDAKAGFFEHEEIIRAVADRDDLIERDAFLLRDRVQEFGFSFGIHNGRDDFAGDDAVFDFEGVCVGVVESELGLERIGDESKTPADDRGFETEGFQNRDELLRAGRESSMRARTCSNAEEGRPASFAQRCCRLSSKLSWPIIAACVMAATSS